MRALFNGTEQEEQADELDYRGGEEGERKECGLDKREKAREREFSHEFSLMVKEKDFIRKGLD